MFGAFRKHHKWIWVVLLIFVIPSFVIYFAPDVGTGSGGRDAINLGTIDGRPITRDEYLRARREVALFFRLFRDTWPDTAQSEEAMDNETIQRVLMLRRLKGFQVEIADDALVQHIRRTFAGQGGAYDPAIYQRYVKMLEEERGITEDQLHEFLRHQLALTHLNDVFGMSGALVPPRAAADLWRAGHEQVVSEAVFLYASNHLDKVEVTTNDLAQFYANRRASYEIPARVQVHYLAFEAINYLGEAAKEMAKLTNLTAILDEEYTRRGTNSFIDKDGGTLGPEAAREEIKNELRKTYALSFARKDAALFANTLFDQEPHSTSNFLALAASSNLTAKVTEPFTSVDGPSDIKVQFEFSSAAFRLSETQPLSFRPVLGEEAVFLIAFHKRLPTELPPLEKVRERVVEDFKRDQAARLMQKAGQEFYQALTNGIAGGKSFGEIAAAKDRTVVKMPAISRSSSAPEEVSKHVRFSSYQSAVLNLPAGEISRFTDAGDAGFIVRVIERKPGPEEELKKDLPEYLANMREFYQRQAFNGWLEQQSQSVQLPAKAKKGSE
jgi:peptidyl-prolyl cis-trans isomerase D